MAASASTEITHTTIHTNGVNLHVAQAGPEDGKLIIFLHGFPEAWFGWRYQIPYFAERDYRVWAPDQRGYNLSDKPRWIADYSIDELASDVVGLIDASGREKVYLVGHDWGGIAAWRTAQAYPQRIEKMAILNVAHHTVARQFSRTVPKQLLKFWYVMFFQLPFLPQRWYSANDWDIGVKSLLAGTRKGTFTREDLDRYKESWRRTGDGSSMINWYRAMAQIRVRRLPSPRITVPTLLLWGEKDQAQMREMAQASIDLCDNGKLIYFEDTSHWIQHEEPDRVNQEIEAFLSASS